MYIQVELTVKVNVNQCKYFLGKHRRLFQKRSTGHFIVKQSLAKPDTDFVKKILMLDKVILIKLMT